MSEFFLDNPLLLLFVVVAIGYPLGRIKIRGSSLGLASVLFAGLFVGALDDDLELPSIIYQLGLVLFVYTVGLSNGRRFFASFRRRGSRDSLLVVSVVSVATGLSLLAHSLLNLKPAFTSGMFAGSLTNTPSLAAQLEYIKESAPAGSLEQALAEPVVGYSVAYPFGVLGVMLAILLAQRIWKIDYRHEASRVESSIAAPEKLRSQTVLISRNEAVGKSVRDLIAGHGWDVVFGRLLRQGRTTVVSGATIFQFGDLVSVIGEFDATEKVVATMGEPSELQLELDRSLLDFRRIFVSSPSATGHRLRDLSLRQRFDAVVTRVRRGDVEFLAHGDTVLEPGDRVRVIAPRQSMQAVTAFFGDSYRAVSEIDILTFSLGLALGLALGMVPIPLPGGIDIELGLAGGPLIVALVLGALDRTGPLVWTLPYSANLTLRQLGFLLFLAGIGIGAGSTFLSTLRNGEGTGLLIAGAAVTFCSAMTALVLGYKVLRIPMGVTIGMVAGIHTQPAALGFALEQSGDDLPNVGYAAVFPMATIAKIIAGQLILALLM